MVEIAPGLVFVGSAYIIAAVFFNLALPKCIEQPCQSEGVDDSGVSWASNFFVASAFVLFGLHLFFFKNGIRRTAILAFIFMGASFCVTGLTSALYGNNGLTDGTGTEMYWGLSAIASYALAFSAACQGSFAVQAANSMDKLRFNQISFFCTRFFSVAVCLAAAVNIFGSISCILSPEIHAEATRDNDADEHDFDDNNQCIRVTSTSTVIIWLFYALLWIPMGRLLRESAKEESLFILGLPTEQAAFLAPVFQWCSGTIFFVLMSGIAWYQGDLGTGFIEIWEKVYGTEIFHFGMLLSLYCLHNLAWVFLTSEALNAKYGVEVESTTTEEYEEDAPPMTIDPRSMQARARDRYDEDDVPEEVDQPYSEDPYYVEENPSHVEMDRGDDRLWTLTIPSKKKHNDQPPTQLRQLDNQSVEISMLSNDASVTTRGRGRDSSATEKTGNWFSRMTENFFLGPKPDKSVASRKSAKSQKKSVHRPTMEPVEEVDEEREEDSLSNQPVGQPIMTPHETGEAKYIENSWDLNPPSGASPNVPPEARNSVSQSYSDDDWEYPIVQEEYPVLEEYVVSPHRYDNDWEYPMVQGDYPAASHRSRSPRRRAASPVATRSPRTRHSYAIDMEAPISPADQTRSPARSASRVPSATSSSRRELSSPLTAAISPGVRRAMSPDRLVVDSSGQRRAMSPPRSGRRAHRPISPSGRRVSSPRRASSLERARSPPRDRNIRYS